jgi:hypothetical protein
MLTESGSDAIAAHVAAQCKKRVARSCPVGKMQESFGSGFGARLQTCSLLPSTITIMIQNELDI